MCVFSSAGVEVKLVIYDHECQVLLTTKSGGLHTHTHTHTGSSIDF